MARNISLCVIAFPKSSSLSAHSKGYCGASLHVALIRTVNYLKQVYTKQWFCMGVREAPQVQVGNGSLTVPSEV